jgi:hypothetical protein
MTKSFSANPSTQSRKSINGKSKISTDNSAAIDSLTQERNVAIAVNASTADERDEAIAARAGILNNYDPLILTDANQINIVHQLLSGLNETWDDVSTHQASSVTEFMSIFPHGISRFD